MPISSWTLGLQNQLRSRAPFKCTHIFCHLRFKEVAINESSPSDIAELWALISFNAMIRELKAIYYGLKY